jgi:tRNA(Ile)-lysidine synthase
MPHVLTAEQIDAGGPEASARAARYAALDRAVTELRLTAVLLGHTLDDQAETVLLGLARGAGARALSGMSPVRGPYLRPLLGVDRATTHQACAEARAVAWQDPHNDDPAFARVRVRRRVLPVLEAELGPGVAAALARSAAQLREDADALDALTPSTSSVKELAALLPALRSRALKRWAEAACGTAVTSQHVDALRALVDDWHGQGPVALPGGVQVERRDGRLACARDG